MGFQFAGKAVYSAVWIAAFSLFMELLGFSTQKWVTAGGLGTVLLTLAGREVWDLLLLLMFWVPLYFSGSNDILAHIDVKCFLSRYLQTSFQVRWFMQLVLLCLMNGFKRSSKDMRFLVLLRCVKLHIFYYWMWELYVQCIHTHTHTLDNH